MTLVSSIGASQTATGPAPAAQTESEQQFNNFLRLLTAQVKNQDPLSPIDSTQFVQQLATFSSLEQQVKSNVTLDTIARTVTDLYGMVAGQWPARPTEIPSTWMHLSGGPVDFALSSPPGIDSAQLVVRNANGAELAREPIDLTTSTVRWAGLGGESNPAAGQLLQFSFEFFAGGNFFGAAAPRPIA